MSHFLNSVWALQSMRPFQLLPKISFLNMWCKIKQCTMYMSDIVCIRCLVYSEEEKQLFNLLFYKAWQSVISFQYVWPDIWVETINLVGFPCNPPSHCYSHCSPSDDGKFDLYSQLRPKTNYALAAAYKTLKMMMRESASSTVQISRFNQLVKQGKKCGHERVTSFFSPGPEPRGNESHFCRIFLLFLLSKRFLHRQLVCLTRRHP